MTAQLKIMIHVLGKCMSAERKIMLIPNDQITANPEELKVISKFHAKFTIVSSITANQIPRFKRKELNSALVFRLPTKNAEIPARKQNVGAQK